MFRFAPRWGLGYATPRNFREEGLWGPIHSSMTKQEHDSPKVGREKQRRLLGQTEKAPSARNNPKVVPKALNRTYSG